MTTIPPEEAFSNEPEFVAKRVVLTHAIFNTGELTTEISSTLDQIGTFIGESLKEHCTPLRPNDKLPYGWIAKHARDGVRVALEETLFAAMNTELGLPEDYQP